MQQTFLCALTALRSGTEVRHLRGWLHQILRSVAVRGSAAPGLGAGIEEADVLARSAEQVAEARMLARTTLNEIVRLPSRQQDALIQTAIQGRSRGEVAGAMGLSEGAVRQLVHRARATLRTAVGALTPFPLLRGASTRGGSRWGAPSDAMAGAGAASAGGVVLKMGTLLATGAVATGLISSPLLHHSRAPLAVRPAVVQLGGASAGSTAASPSRYATHGYSFRVQSGIGGLPPSSGNLGTRTADRVSLPAAGPAAQGQRAHGRDSRHDGGSPPLWQVPGGSSDASLGHGGGDAAQSGGDSGPRGGPGPGRGGSDHSGGEVSGSAGAQRATCGKGSGHDLGGTGSGSSGTSGVGAAPSGRDGSSGGGGASGGGRSSDGGGSTTSGSSGPAVRAPDAGSDASRG